MLRNNPKTFSQEDQENNGYGKSLPSKEELLEHWNKIRAAERKQ